MMASTARDSQNCDYSPTFSRKRVLPAAPDVRALGRHRNHEAETHPDPAEQDRSDQGGAGEGAARADQELHRGHGGGGRPHHPHLRPAQVQHRGGVRVHHQEDPRASPRLHQ